MVSVRVPCEVVQYYSSCGGDLNRVTLLVSNLFVSRLQSKKIHVYSNKLNLSFGEKCSDYICCELILKYKVICITIRGLVVLFNLTFSVHVLNSHVCFCHEYVFCHVR